MCGRFAMDEAADEAIAAWVARGGRPDAWKPSDWVDPARLEPRYTIAPHTIVPILQRGDDSQTASWGQAAVWARAAVWAEWGFRPSWARDNAPSPINARLETAPYNGYFKTAFARYRCAVVMSGYFEWVKAPDGKQPYYLHGDGPLYAAALTSGLGEDRNFAIITHPGFDEAGTVHDRMPVFLTPDACEAWMDPSPVARRGGVDALAAMVADSAQQVASSISVYPVSRAVNNVRTANPDDQSLIEPLDAV